MVLKRFFFFGFFLFVIVFLLTVFYTVYTGWLSFSIMWVALFAGSFSYLRRAYKDQNTVLSFVIPFCVYSLYMYITNYLFVKDPYIDFFMMVDSKKFWSFSDYQLQSFSDVVDAQGKDYLMTIRYTLFNFGNLCLSFFAQIFDENNILVQKLQSVWLGAFSIPFVYLSLKKYFPTKQSLVYALFYAFFTHVFIYSVVFNRDPHVYLLYTIGAYIITNHNTVKNGLGKLVLLFVLICGFRLEHGLFFSAFILLYLWVQARSKPRLKVLVIALIPIVGLIAFPFFFGKYQENTDTYEGHLERVERTEASAAVLLNSLPPGIKETLMAVNSQVAPAVPFWRSWYPSLNQSTYSRHPVEGYYTPWRFIESIASVVWVYVWSIVLCGLLLKKYKVIPLELNLLFMVSVILLMMASTSVNARRTYCVYPIIFIYCLYIRQLLSPKLRRRVMQSATLVLIGIYCAYYIFKN
ncbi:glycosyltransferase family 39 protein [Sphingobacterium corticibacterium]|uniref:Glycosyltransferase RgtA/B/C/D-like domain-containing protein n=1 Tax=Sphingobacterium corticibacterium TaxID=2484746 RepID=A0A4Q6XQH9_9SPHI|nr:glycosyltransferase family 39 protein [Sphingobacterium corticibacterium]RZF58889.1 hypothetical protein EWE74_16335 [Sphingobacterium corticibacterium]